MDFSITDAGKLILTCKSLTGGSNFLLEFQGEPAYFLGEVRYEQVPNFFKAATDGRIYGNNEWSGRGWPTSRFFPKVG